VIVGSGATGNLVQGNRIGTDYTGAVALGNGGSGVFVLQAAANNLIGGTTAGAGNVISANRNDGVALFSSGNQVQGNWIGTDASGAQALGNAQNGVESQNAANNTIGGTAAGAGNTISGNAGQGVLLTGAGATGTLVQGNLIGTTSAGTAPLPNAGSGVWLASGANHNTVGGMAAGAGNLLSGNGYHGLAVDGSGVTGNLVQGNLIGTDITGGAALGNGHDGVVVAHGASNNMIGGTEAGAANTIAFNGYDGVLVDGGTGNGIRQNSIYASGHLGIELVNNGNNNQAFPVLTSATSDAATSTIEATLVSTPDSTFVLELFANDVCNPSGFGEGQTFLGYTWLTTDDTGYASFSATFGAAVNPGQFLAATVTDLNNNTSQFSRCVAVTGPTDAGWAVPGGKATLPTSGVEFGPAAGSPAQRQPAEPSSSSAPGDRGSADLLLGQRRMNGDAPRFQEEPGCPLGPFSSISASRGNRMGRSIEVVLVGENVHSLLGRAVSTSLPPF
jgi:hypothetical protein